MGHYEKQHDQLGVFCRPMLMRPMLMKPMSTRSMSTAPMSMGSMLTGPMPTGPMPIHHHEEETLSVRRRNRQIHHSPHRRSLPSRSHSIPFAKAHWRRLTSLRLDMKGDYRAIIERQTCERCRLLKLCRTGRMPVPRTHWFCFPGVVHRFRIFVCSALRYLGAV